MKHKPFLGKKKLLDILGLYKLKLIQFLCTNYSVHCVDEAQSFNPVCKVIVFAHLLNEWEDYRFINNYRKTFDAKQASESTKVKC